MANKKVVIGLTVACGAIIIGLAIFLGIYLTRDTEDDLMLTEPIETDIGSIRGLRAASDDYSMFLGIPYAEVNKSNPFGLSKPFPKFEKTFDATDDSTVCPQIDIIKKEATGSIDCLNLNVYKPDSANSNNLVPVIVFLNGDEFSSGHSSKNLYGPEFLIRHDVIVVSINYRVGAYGFMCLDIPEVPGNQGLKDQVLALKWIKSNINSFGGNENKITILGHAAGARSVDYHLISGQEKIFNQAILQSGVAIAPSSAIDADNSLPLRLALALNFNTNSATEAIAYLASAETNDVLNAASQLKYSFVPCIEKGSEKFLSDHPANLKPSVMNMPILLGVTNNEQLANYDNKPSEFYENVESIIKTKISNNFDLSNSTLDRIVEIVRRFYLGDDVITTEEKKQNIANFDSDFQYVHPNQRRIYDFMENGASALFNYVFEYEGTRNFGQHLNNIAESDGAVHGDELGYLFNIPIFAKHIPPNDQLMIDRITSMWTNFAKYGNPTPEINELLSVKWEPVTSDVLHYFKIDHDLALDNRPFRERLTFWDLFYKLNEDFQTAVYLTRTSVNIDDSLLVNTTSGWVRGVVSKDEDYHMFLGIPYAVVNRTNPFGPSLPASRAEEIIEANSDEKICPQISTNPGIQTLDCLHLNVFVPKKSHNQHLPVLVFIYGGSFTEGSYRTYGASFLIRHEVILVTLNYRTSVYGFMCLDIPEVPGNQGLKDQVTALRWVKNNIEYFGGDKNLVTIFGQSAGGRSVDFHLMSDQEKLFDKAILQSGNSMCHPGLTEPDNSLPLRLAQYFDYNTDSVYEAISYLASKDVEEVVTAASKIDYTFRACIEKRFDNVESIITSHPLVRDIPKIKDTPLIVGFTNNERILSSLLLTDNLQSKKEVITDLLNDLFRFDNVTLNNVEDIIHRFYLGDEKISELVLEKVANFETDFIYAHPQQRRISDFMKNGATVYHYMFTHDGERNYMKKTYNVTYFGAAHADEISYLFDIASITDEIPAEDLDIIDRITTLWTNFAKYGNPTPEISKVLPVKWEPVTTDIQFYLNIATNMTMSNRPLQKRLTFWDLFYKTYGDLQKLGYNYENN